MRLCFNDNKTHMVELINEISYECLENSYCNSLQQMCRHIIYAE